DLAPFRAVRFDPQRLPPAAAICPPYDVIREDAHRRLLDHHPRNAVRWILGEDPDHPLAGDEEYRRRGQDLRGALAAGDLLQDTRRGYYLYRCTTTDAAGTPQSYQGILGAVRALPWGEEVLPHEQVRPAVVGDRARLRRAAAVDLGVIQLVVTDADGALRRALEAAPREELFRGPDWRGDEHSLARIDDAAAVEELRGVLASRVTVVADGHHRYAAAVEARDHAGLPGARRVLAIIGDLHQEGLVIGPTHRLLKWPGPPGPARAAARRIREALDDGEGEEWSLELRTALPIALRTRPRLDGETLAGRLAEVVEGLEPRPEVETSHDLERARLILQRLPGDVLLCRLGAVSREEFWERCSRGQVFPPKTTFFLPKIGAGIVVRLLDESDAVKEESP
ncbi:MAG: DUF1015 family protein, partial [Planctomycetota bacterium]